MNKFFFIFAIFFDLLSFVVIPSLKFLVFHIIASFLFAFSFKGDLKKNLVYFFISFLVPFLGGVFVFWIDKIYLSNLKKRVDKKGEIKRFYLVDLVDKTPKVKVKFSEGVLSNIDILNDVEKLNLLSYLSNKNIKKKGAILKKVLSDNNDEVRLLAFSILSKEEDRLNKEILKRRELLKKREDAFIYKELGELYWEFVFLNIADEELKDFYLNLAKENFEKALNLKEIKEIYFYLGRIYFLKGEMEKAKEYFFLSLDKKTIPYLAEIFYNEGKFEEVMDLINRLKLVDIHQNFYFNYKVWKW